MIFKPGDVVRANFGTWHSNYEGRMLHGSRISTL